MKSSVVVVPVRVSVSFSVETHESLRNALEESEAQSEQLAHGIRSFLSSLPFQPPEALGFQARAKLAEPLATYERDREVAR